MSRAAETSDFSNNIAEFRASSVLRSVVPRVLNAARKVPASCAVCGVELPAPEATGRPRVTCSAACRRRRDHATRKIARRQEWLQQWRACEGRGIYPRARIRREIRELQQEIAALLPLARSMNGELDSTPA